MQPACDRRPQRQLARSWQVQQQSPYHLSALLAFCTLCLPKIFIEHRHWGVHSPVVLTRPRGTRHTVTTGAILSENTRRFSPVTGVQVALGQPVADHGKSFRVAVQLREEETRCRSETASWALARSDFQVSFGNVSVQAQGPLTGDLTGGAQTKSLKGLWQS